jgi:hypothetical protein
MYGLTRGTATLLGAGVAGLILWLATQIDDKSTGGYWAVYGLIAGAGLVMALSQLLGGWTKGGLPKLSANVFLLAFIPTLIAAGWVVVGHQPHPNWFRNHVLNWSDDISILGVVRDMAEYVAVLAFGIGLVFGFSFDTSAPGTYGSFGRRRRTSATPAGGAVERGHDGNGRAGRTTRLPGRTREREREPEPAQRH